MPEAPTAAAVRENEQLRAEVLDLPEWYRGSCPWCENLKHWGHAETCPRELVLEILTAALS